MSRPAWSDLDEYIDRLVADFPPLSPAQIDRLRGLLTPTADQPPRTDRAA